MEKYKVTCTIHVRPGYSGIQLELEICRDNVLFNYVDFHYGEHVDTFVRNYLKCEIEEYLSENFPEYTYKNCEVPESDIKAIRRDLDSRLLFDVIDHGNCIEICI